MKNSREKAAGNNSSIVHAVLIITIVDAILVGVSWILGWPSINETALFFLGLLVLIAGYVIDNLFFGIYRTGGPQGYVSMSPRDRMYNRSGTDEEAEFDQYRLEEGDIAVEDLPKEKKHSTLWLNVSFSGAVAMALSLLLLRFF